MPDLDEAWCNAAYWYHEALAEPLDTVAVAKLETAIEVLFRSENMDGSKKRIISSFDAIFDLSEADVIREASSRFVSSLWPSPPHDRAWSTERGPHFILIYRAIKVSSLSATAMSRPWPVFFFWSSLTTSMPIPRRARPMRAQMPFSAWIKAKRLSGGAKSSLRPSVP